ncbi:MAG TPA: PAS domain-containing protein [Skermanella sp.]|nr:PAS domain-containing protein [Skermanella sp.]
MTEHHETTPDPCEPGKGPDAGFLSGGGTMGALMRSHDWRSSPLGLPETWPQSLRTVVSLLLNSKFPMFVAWGPQLAFLYNDGYLPIFGAKHPKALGRPFAEVWSEIWDDIGPLVDHAMAGEATFHEDLPLRMLRHGYPEDTWFTFSYSPVHDESGGVGGMFCACFETTGQIIGERRLRDSEARWRGLFERMQEGFYVGEALRDGEGRMRDFRFIEVNPAFGALTGIPASDAVGRTVLDVIPDIPVELIRHYERVIDTGEPTRFEVFIPALADRWYEARARKAGDERVAVLFLEITDRKRTERRHEALLEFGDRLRDVAELSEITRTAADILARTLDAPDVGYGEIAEGEERLSVIHSHSGAIPEAEGFWRDFADDLTAGKVVAVSDVNLDPRTASGTAGYDGQGISSFACAPIAEAGRIAAILWVQDNRPREWAAEELVFIREIADRTWAAVKHARAEEELKQGERRFRMLVDLAPTAVWLGNPDGSLSYLSDGWYDYTGQTTADALPLGWWDAVHPDDRDHVHTTWEESRKRGEFYDVELRLRGRDGGYRWFVARANPLHQWNGSAQDDPEAGKVTGWFGATVDIDGQKAAEEELRALNAALEERVRAAVAERELAQEALRQSQKMEAVGQLTGGVAHDFNNLLQAILGNLDILSDKLTGHDELLRHVRFAMQAGDRAATLTQRLLAFARRQPLAPTSVNLNALVGGMQELLQRSVGEAIQVEAILAGGLWRTWADANQVENGLLNLAINARDAMPSGGKLTIETANSHLDDSYVSGQLGLHPGQYVLLSVTDTGSGMPHDVLSRAFEPFYTTKPIGQGTGLGLSQLYGFARQSGGHVAIYSEEGHGTTVKLYLPRHRSAAEAADIAAAPPEPAAANEGETILVVEDEGLVRMLMVQTLEDKGYRVIEAHEAQGAIRILESDMKIDLLATDVGLPGMNGRQLAETARGLRPDLSVLFLTGYAHNAALGDEPLGPRTHLISKPFAVKTLLTKIRTMLEEAAR